MNTMSETVTGVTISQLTPTATLNETDYVELEREGEAYAVTVGDLVEHVNNALGISDLAESLAAIIG